MTEPGCVNPATGKTYDFQGARVSGISVGVPGSPLVWQTALRRWGTISWRDALRPAARGAEDGFVVGQTFAPHGRGNLNQVRRFSSTRAPDPPGGAPPPGGPPVPH